MLEEITIYGRGGQGGVTAARLVALAAMIEGYYSQAMPQFGPERRGAVVQAFLRISDRPIRRHSMIRKPTMIVLFDSKISPEIGLMSAVKTAVVNTTNSVKIADKTWIVDATEIAEKLGLVSAGWTVVSTPMSGAMSKALGISFTSLEEAIKEEVEFKLEANISAAKKAYEVVRWI
jgi:pyruvate ferredoxin oxidoreductase gamma subunit